MRVATTTCPGPVETTRSGHAGRGRITNTSHTNWTKELGPSTRYWKNRANSAIDGEFSPAQFDRMAAGKPPLHPSVGVPMELDHIVPRHLGGTHAPGNLREVWPWQHAELDPYRYYNGPTP